MNTLITGALGHIGTKLLESLGSTHQVTVVDNGSTGIDYRKLQEKYRNFELVLEDLRDIPTQELKAILKDKDLVVHLAATVNAIETVNNEEAVFVNNRDVTTKLADAAISRVSKFVFMSTASVYGPSPYIRYPYSSDLNPQTPYAVSKLEAERSLMHRAHEFDAMVIYRAGTIYGMSDGIRYHTAINQFVRNACIGEPIKVWLPGTGKRPYVHVKSMVNLLLKHFYDTSMNPRLVLENVVDCNWSPKDIIEIIEDVLGPIKIEYVTPRILNQDSYILDGNLISEDHNRNLLRSFVTEVKAVHNSER